MFLNDFMTYSLHVLLCLSSETLIMFFFISSSISREDDVVQSNLKEA